MHASRMHKNWDSKTVITSREAITSCHESHNGCVYNSGFKMRALAESAVE